MLSHLALVGAGAVQRHVILCGAVLTNLVLAGCCIGSVDRDARVRSRSLVALASGVGVLWIHDTGGCRTMQRTGAGAGAEAGAEAGGGTWAVGQVPTELIGLLTTVVFPAVTARSALLHVPASVCHGAENILATTTATATNTNTHVLLYHTPPSNADTPCPPTPPSCLHLPLLCLPLPPAACCCHLPPASAPCPLPLPLPLPCIPGSWT